MPRHLSSKNIDQYEVDFSSLIKLQGKGYVLDMGKVDCLYSKGYRLIIYLIREILGNKGMLSIVNMNESVEKLIKEVNLHKMIPVFRTLKEFETKKKIIPTVGQK